MTLQTPPHLTPHISGSKKQNEAELYSVKVHCLVTNHVNF